MEPFKEIVQAPEYPFEYPADRCKVRWRVLLLHWRASESECLNSKAVEQAVITIRNL